jgi:hypothetical protein
MIANQLFDFIAVLIYTGMNLPKAIRITVGDRFSLFFTLVAERLAGHDLMKSVN